MTAAPEVVPAILDRIRRTLVGLRMPRALEVLDRTVRQLERGEVSALDAIDTLLAEELTVREKESGNIQTFQRPTKTRRVPCRGAVHIADNRLRKPRDAERNPTRSRRRPAAFL